jgi:hypothetical protein
MEYSLTDSIGPFGMFRRLCLSQSGLGIVECFGPLLYRIFSAKCHMESTIPYSL